MSVAGLSAQELGAEQLGAEELSRVRRDWRDTARVAADLALFGLLVSAAALPVITAGAAVGAGSAALHHYLEHDRWPGPRWCWREFWRRLLPGFAALLACAAAAVLVAVDLHALAARQVPGGGPLMVLTVAVAVTAVGYLGLMVVATGTGQRVLSAAKARPSTVAAAAGVVAIAALLAALVHPALSPVLAGYTMFALHVVARRAPARRDAVVDPSVRG